MRSQLYAKLKKSGIVDIHMNGVAHSLVAIVYNSSDYLDKYPAKQIFGNTLYTYTNA